MQPILANYTASITELKKSPTQLLKDAGDEAIAILNHNVASAYLVPASLYEKMMEVMDDYYLSKELEERLKDNEKPIRVELDELLSWFSSKSFERGIAYDDEALGIDWNIPHAILNLSAKDKTQPLLKDTNDLFDYGVDYYNV